MVFLSMILKPNDPSWLQRRIPPLGIIHKAFISTRLSHFPARENRSAVRENHFAVRQDRSAVGSAVRANRWALRGAGLPRGGAGLP